MLRSALDPNVKLAYAEHQWDKESFNIGLKSFEQIFDKYYVPTVSVPADLNMEQEPVGHGQYGRSWVLAAVQAHQVSDCVQAKPRAELTAYFQSPLEQTEDVVGWWGDGTALATLQAALQEEETESSTQEELENILEEDIVDKEDMIDKEDIVDS
ncbi:hypothetical protein BDR03DRAFT_1012331 [Suillus americanus]|nr:hypothetical protein BDR03DRAFT_1012331 [Suillus americanus]